LLQEKPREDLEKVIKLCDYWTIQFLNSKYCKELDEEQLWQCPYIILNFIESMCIHFDLTPNEWNKEALEEWFIFILPKKVSVDKSFFRAIPPILSKFFSFLYDNRVIKNDINLKMGLFTIKQRIINAVLIPEI
jgi:hypothetical protein